MSTPKLVEAFYARIWNAGDLGAASDLLIEDFSFRGSLGVELKGRETFADYVRSVRSAFANYRCEILTCVSEGEQAFAKIHFSGIHVAPFRGYSATAKPIHWLGAAFFQTAQHRCRPTSGAPRLRLGELTLAPLAAERPNRWSTKLRRTYDSREG
jgi:hypothetical protein